MSSSALPGKGIVKSDRQGLCSHEASILLGETGQLNMVTSAVKEIQRE